MLAIESCGAFRSHSLQIAVLHIYQMVMTVYASRLFAPVRHNLFDVYSMRSLECLMSKSIIDAPLTTRAARLRLAPGVHFRSIDPDTHLGYRRSKRAGRWLVRWRVGVGYRQATLASADDALEANGSTTLSYDQAVRSARSFVQQARNAATAVATGPWKTVRLVAEVYADAVEARQKESGRAISRDCRSRFTMHVFGDPIADVPLHALTAKDLRAWRDRIRAKSLAPATIRRIVTDLRSALNEAARNHGSTLQDRFPIELRDGFAAVTQDRQTVASTVPSIILPDADVRRLISAAREIDAEEGWDGDLARLVVGLAATGTRFSQLARCTVADLQISTRRLMVPVSRKGRGAKAVSHTAVPLGDDVIAELRSAVAGRRGHEPLFLRWGYKRGAGIKWEKSERRAWLAAEISKPFRLIAERAELSADTTAYALRHSSIVRGLRAGLAVRLVAALHDTGSAMIERHYSAHITDAMTDAARLAVVPLADTADVHPIRAVR